jgi:hypothetical protein
VNPRATLANLCWLTTSVPACHRFVRALRDPAAVQRNWLRRHLGRNSDTAYGRAHGCAEIQSYAEFARRVPMIDYDGIEPWVVRIKRGEARVLSAEAVSRLVPTSGTSGARKLIPFTTSLQHEFNAAVSPWMIDLSRRTPSLAFGPAYWSITPMGALSAPEESLVPIGFEDDAEYLGGARAWLVKSAMAVPAEIRHIADLADFRHSVLLHLLRCRDLRLISVWHPSFLSLLLDTLIRDWDFLLLEIAKQEGRRAIELRSANPAEPTTLWPHLRVVSCWADAHAKAPAEELKRRLPGVIIQPKGLLATEGCITLPFSGTHPVAVCSHFFEFLDENNAVHPVEDLQESKVYEVVITTGGGLWRYRLGDLVEVTGFIERTPTLRFLGRVGTVSDRCGEKLSDAFMTQVIAKLCPAAPFAMLAPERWGEHWRYALFVENDGEPPGQLTTQLDAGLSANPHYALCRRLGQLGPARVARVAGNAYARFTTAETARGMRLGDIKPAALSQRTDWSTTFGCESAVESKPQETPAHM